MPERAGRLFTVLFLCVVIVAAAQWSAASMAHGYRVSFHPMFAFLYSPVDSLRWQWLLNQRCLLVPSFTDFFQPPFLRGNQPVARCAPSVDAFIESLDLRFAFLLGIGLLPGAGLWANGSIAKKRAKSSRGRFLKPATASAGERTPFVVDIGQSTGTLKKLGAASGLAARQRVILSEDDISLDVAVIGSKGSGKTQSVISPILLQTLRSDAGALIFDVKQNFSKIALALAARVGRTVRIVGVGPDAEQLDLLDGVSPSTAATYIHSVLLLLGNTDKSSTFWNTQARLLSENVLGLLAFLPYEFYSLAWLHRYVEEPARRAMIDAKIEAVLREKAKSLECEAAGREAARKIAADIRSIQNAKMGVRSFFRLKDDDTIKVGAKANLKQVLEDMARPLYEDAFGRSGDGAKSARLEELLDGAVFVVSCPSGESSNVAMAFLKLKFYDLMLARLSNPELNSTRRVAFIVDEIQAVVTAASHGMSDHAFLALSRETKTFCVFSTQSVEGLISKIGPVATNALLANLRQKILLQTDCKETIANALYLLGKTEVVRQSKSEQRQPFSWFATRGVSAQPTREDIGDPSLIRNLRKGQALFLGNIGMENSDDIITLNRVVA